MGFFIVSDAPRPDRSIHLSKDRIYWPPAGCIKSEEAACRIFPRIGRKDADARLRAMRARTADQDRGPAGAGAAK